MKLGVSLIVSSVTIFKSYVIDVMIIIMIIIIMIMCVVRLVIQITMEKHVLCRECRRMKEMRANPWPVARPSGDES